MAPIIELRNVSKSYGNREVLRGINFRIEVGETKIVLGGSGQGKSTILRHILGLEKPDEGQILVGGVDIVPLEEVELVPVRKKMGMVFQEASLFDSLSVFDNIAYRLEEELVPDDEIIKTTKRLLHLVDLQDDDLVKLPSQLSGGMKRRVAIARGMAGTHNIMLYDEPTAGLDPITESHITKLIIRLRDLEKVSSMIVTQDLISSFQLMTMCAHREEGKGVEVKVNPAHPCTSRTNMVILKDGRILTEGNLAQLLASTDPYVQEFLSSLRLLATHPAT